MSIDVQTIHERVIKGIANSPSEWAIGAIGRGKEPCLWRFEVVIVNGPHLKFRVFTLMLSM